MSWGSVAAAYAGHSHGSGNFRTNSRSQRAGHHEPDGPPQRCNGGAVGHSRRVIVPGECCGQAGAIDPLRDCGTQTGAAKHRFDHLPDRNGSNNKCMTCCSLPQSMQSGGQFLPEWPIRYSSCSYITSMSGATLRLQTAPRCWAKSGPNP
jgi:hypothetical protein